MSRNRRRIGFFGMGRGLWQRALKRGGKQPDIQGDQDGEQNDADAFLWLRHGFLSMILTLMVAIPMPGASAGQYPHPPEVSAVRISLPPSRKCG
ncbi:MAG: hypothetical protein WBJ23_07455 [Anaerolineaceae bacterium]